MHGWSCRRVFLPSYSTQRLRRHTGAVLRRAFLVKFGVDAADEEAFFGSLDWLIVFVFVGENDAGRD